MKCYFFSLTLAAIVSYCCGNLDKCLQPDDVLDGKYDDLKANQEKYPNICTRICDGKPKLCYYKFRIEHFSCMGPACRNCSNGVYNDCLSEQCITADGIQRAILSFNRRLPGPTIQVCRGDTIVVDAINRLGAGSTTIHWHGIKQKGTQYYDGVPKVTQCPIEPGTTFRYQFKPEDPGTFFYHSHLGTQRVDGLAGPLVVRQPIKDEIYSNLYDYDLPSHVVFVLDWMHALATEKLPGLTDSPQLPDSYLINGRGRFPGTPELPLTEYLVKPGKRYRFRLIGATGFSCTSIVKFQGHRLTVIHTDGAGFVQPVVVDSVVLDSADRFDVILNATQPPGVYYVLVRQENCEKVVPPVYAILRYEGVNGLPDFSKPIESKSHVMLNPTNKPCNTSSHVCVSNLKGTEAAPFALTKRKTDLRILIQFGFYTYTIDDLFRKVPVPGFIASSIISTNISFVFPPSPLISQYYDIPQSSFCNPECYMRPNNKLCSCTNIYNIPLGASVTVIITDQMEHTPKSGLSHPFHLHGYNFYVLEIGIFSGDIDEGVKELDRRLNTGELCAGNMPARKDSIGVPSGGYVVIQFIADNPGFWLMHCHFNYHLDSGMGAVFRVGEFSDLPPIPFGFPKCGNYEPPPYLL